MLITSHTGDHEWLRYLERFWVRHSGYVLRQLSVRHQLTTIARQLPFGGVGDSGCEKFIRSEKSVF